MDRYMDKYLIYPKQFKKSNFPIEKNRCFVLMPFDKRYDLLYATIKNELNDSGLQCYRDDEISGTEPIMNKVITNILKSTYIIVILTDYRPNILYELGITHTFKDIQNVLMLVERNSNVSAYLKKDTKPSNKASDLSHLTYCEYSPDCVFEVRAVIRSFIETNKPYVEFFDALQKRKLIGSTEKDDVFANYIYDNLSNSHIQLFTSILSHNSEELSESDVKMACDVFEETIRHTTNEHKDDCDISAIILIYAEILSVCSTYQPAIIEHRLTVINQSFMNLNLGESMIRSLMTELILYLAKQNKLLTFTIPWVINYFKESWTGGIDLNRYKVEEFLLYTNNEIINQAVCTALFDQHCKIREHMADLIGEKRLHFARDTLEVQLSREENEYTARSIIVALGKLGFHESAQAIIDWINKKERHILDANQYFLINRSVTALERLKTESNSNYINSFIKKFNSIEEKYRYFS